MKQRMNLILSSITFIVTVGLLILIVNAWYVSNRNVSANGINAGTSDDSGVNCNIRFLSNQSTVESVNLIPGDVCEVKLEVTDDTIETANMSFTPKMAWKNVKIGDTEYTYSEYSALNPKSDIDQIVTQVKNVKKYTDLERFYGINEYYLNSTRTNLDLATKKTLFSSLYGAENYNILNKINVLFSSTQITKSNYYDLKQACKNGTTYNDCSWQAFTSDFKLNNVDITSAESTFDETKTYYSKTGDNYTEVTITEEEYLNGEYYVLEGENYILQTPYLKMYYMYFYFDETEDNITVKDSNNVEYIFKSENQYFYQMINLDVLITKA